jgi:hypothetical protein
LPGSQLLHSVYFIVSPFLTLLADGIDPDSCQNVDIHDCFISTGGMDALQILPLPCPCDARTSVC